MMHIEGAENITEKYLAEFKTKSVYEIIEKWRTDNQISPVKELRKVIPHKTNSCINKIAL